MTKVLNKTEIPNEGENLTLREAGEKTESVKATLLSSLAAAKTDELGDLLFEAHDELLPTLFQGWLASEDCSMMNPGQRAATFNRYNALQKLLADLDQVLDRLPLDILKSI